MKKTLYNLVTAIVVLSMGMFCSCSEDNEGFITATEDDFPQILLPWFGDWEDGEPAVYKSISRDAEFIDSTVGLLLSTPLSSGSWMTKKSVMAKRFIFHRFLPENIS